MRGSWDAVGGFLSGSETAEDCLRREALEEIGCELLEVAAVGTFSSVYGDTGLRTIGIAFRCTIAPGSTIKLSNENDDYEWFPLSAVPDVAFADVREAVASLRDQSDHSQPGH